MPTSNAPAGVVTTRLADPNGVDTERGQWRTLGLISGLEGVGAVYLSVSLLFGLKPSTLLDYGYYSPNGRAIMTGVVIAGVVAGAALIVGAAGALRKRRWGLRVGAVANLALLVASVANVLAGGLRCPWLVKSAWVEACDSFSHVFPKSLIVYSLLFIVPPIIYLVLLGLERWSVARRLRSSHRAISADAPA